MQLRNKLVIIASIILAGCSAPRPTSIDKAFKVCAEGEDPIIAGCKKIGATAPITIRGYKED